MPAIIDNLTRLTGVIVERQPHPVLTGFDQLDVRVDQSEPVPGKADLLADTAGSILFVAVRTPLVATARPGAGIQFRAARTSSGWVMAEPYPAVDDFEIDSSTPTIAEEPDTA